MNDDNDNDIEIGQDDLDEEDEFDDDDDEYKDEDNDYEGRCAYLHSDTYSHFIIAMRSCLASPSL
ncbi:hypothetical protein G9P44_004235 [Scheffersomyces stipitis]|nr:hypothetical protein G9P44_004235 [Scheffersomyces stipitis]